ncbi:hypothetical protein ACMT4L_16955 [Deinococcus sp. A31D244]|uniref:hypothetical protein n=1 Tax=Deinococcus sp. A31D244 TaxID=3397675 RepID=UPI0039E1065D
MPGKRADRIALRTLTQQRQEQQRATPTSTPETSGKGVRGQRQANTAPTADGFGRYLVRNMTKSEFRFAPPPVNIALSGIPMAFQPVSQYQPLSPAYAAPVKPAPSIPEVGQRIDEALAHIPQRHQPLTPAQDAALDLLDALTTELARYLSPQVLIDRLPALGTAAGQAVRNAISEAGQ